MHVWHEERKKWNVMYKKNPLMRMKRVLARKKWERKSITLLCHRRFPVVSFLLLLATFFPSSPLIWNVIKYNLKIDLRHYQRRSKCGWDLAYFSASTRELLFRACFQFPPPHVPRAETFNHLKDSPILVRMEKFLSFFFWRRFARENS